MTESKFKVGDHVVFNCELTRDDLSLLLKSSKEWSKVIWAETPLNVREATDKHLLFKGFKRPWKSVHFELANEPAPQPGPSQLQQIKDTWKVMYNTSPAGTFAADSLFADFDDFLDSLTDEPDSQDSRSYDKGYQDGESNHQADWEVALDGLLPEGVEAWPSQVAKYLETSVEQARQEERQVTIARLRYVLGSWDGDCADQQCLQTWLDELQPPKPKTAEDVIADVMCDSDFRPADMIAALREAGFNLGEDS